MAQENNMVTIDEAALAEELNSIALPEEKVSIDWKAAAGGAAVALLVGALIYGGYRGYKAYKEKKEKESKEQA